MRPERGFSLIEMMMVVGMIGVLAAIVVPITGASLSGSRLRGDANVIRNLVGVAKMRASAQFTRARVFVNRGNPAANPPVQGTYVLQLWDRAAAGGAGAWVNDGDVNQLSRGVSFGLGGLNAPPPNTQAVINQSPACTTGLTAADPIANTSCVTFNSRGLPIDAGGNLFPGHALYVNGDDAVFATTVTTTPLIRFWSSPHLATAVWTAR